jgi:hypothetical protein
MTVATRSAFTKENHSIKAGQALAARLLEGIDRPPMLVVCYTTVNHDQAAFLRELHRCLGEQTEVVGCSAQGVMTRGTVCEQGYAAGALALGGDSIEVAGAQVDDIATNTFEKGRELGKQIAAGLTDRPKVTVLHYDPLCGADMGPFLEGLDRELSCPVIGGAAAHFYGPMRETFQYYNQRVFSRGAVGFALAGDFSPELAISTGVSPAGVEMTVTRCDGNCILELDGLHALDIWQEITSAGPPHADHTAALALGVPVDGTAQTGDYLVRAAFGVDETRRGVILQAGIPEGTKVMLHHRTVDDVLQGSQRMGERLRQRLAGKTVRAVLGFECGARTAPFLGEERTIRENVDLQAAVAENADWLGLMAWGEIYPVCGRQGFHNYTFPVCVIAD